MKKRWLWLPVILLMVIMTLAIFQTHSLRKGALDHAKKLFIQQQNQICFQASERLSLAFESWKHNPPKARGKRAENCRPLTPSPTHLLHLCKSEGEPTLIHLQSKDHSPSIHMYPKHIYEKYLSDLVVNFKGDVWVMDRSGLIYICDDIKLVGQNIFSVFRVPKFASFHKLKSHLYRNSAASGYFEYDWPLNNHQVQKRIMSYQSIDFIGRKVLVCNSFSEVDIHKALTQQDEKLNFFLASVLIIILVLGTLIVYFFIKKSRSDLEKGQLSKFLSPKVVEEVMNHKLDLEAQISLRRLSVFFVDLRNFTALSDKVSVTTISEFLTDFYAFCTDAIFEQEGTVDKYLGDSVMAFFGAPNHIDNYPEKAVSCGIKLIDDFPEFKRKWNERLSHHDIGIGISIATGEVIAGPIGTRDKYDYTVIGTTVNLASRIEGLNKRFDAKLSICDITYSNLINNQDFKSEGKLPIRGISEDKEIFFYRPPAG